MHLAVSENQQIHRLPLQKRSASVDWENLKIFIEIAAAGSFSGAARHMRISQATVLRRTRALEEEVGVALFERQAKGYRLTQHGAAFLRRVSGVEKRIDLACRMAMETDHTEHTEIRLIAPGIIEGVIAQTLPAAYRHCPNVNLLLTGQGQDGESSRRAADVIVAIDCPAVPGFELEAVYHLPCGLYASGNYLDAFGKPEEIGALAGHSIIDFDRGPLHDDREPWQLLDRSGARILPCSNSHHARLKVACAGLGMILLTEHNGQAEHGLVKVFSAQSMGTIHAMLFVRRQARAEADMALACSVMARLLTPAAAGAPGEAPWTTRPVQNARLLAASAE